MQLELAPRGGDVAGLEQIHEAPVVPLQDPLPITAALAESDHLLGEREPLAQMRRAPQRDVPGAERIGKRTGR